MHLSLCPFNLVKKILAQFHTFSTRQTKLGLLLFVLSFALAGKAQEQAEYDEITIFLQVQSIGAFEIPALIRNQEVLLPVSDLFNFLKIKNTLSAGLDSVSGFFLSPEATYLVDRTNNKVVFQGKTIQLRPGDLIKTENNLYLLSKYFGEIFSLDCRFNFRALSVNLTTKLELPMMREMRLELMRQNINRLKGEPKVDTVIPRSRPAFSFGMADWSVISTQEAGSRVDARINLGLGTVIAGGEANAYLNYYTNEPFSEKQQYYLWRFVNNDRKFLRQTALGKITTDAVSSIYNPVVGIRLTNSPTTYRRSFGTYPLSDYTTPGWMVELYVNNVLVDYKKADASGFFTFQVPLVYGTSAIKLKFYGPWGEERTKEQQVSIPFNFIPPKEFEYTINAGMVEDSLHSIYSRASMSYGVSRSITVSSGIEYLSSVVSGAYMPFFSLASRPFPNILLAGEYVHGVRTKGIFSYQLPRNIQLELNYTKYKPGQKAINLNYVEDRKFILSLPVSGKNLSFFNRLTYNQLILVGTYYTIAEWLLSGTVHGVSANLTHFGMLAKEGTPYIYNNASLSLRLPHNYLFTPQMQYEYTHGEIISLKAALEKYISKNSYMSLAYENNVKSKVQSVQFSFRYDLPFAQTGVSVRQTNDKTSLMQMARGSLIADVKQRYLKANSRVSVGKGGVIFSPFLDVNCNNKKDENEPRVKGLSIRINGGNSTENTQDTTIIVTDLEPYIKYYVELDPTGFDNVAWKLNLKAMSIMADPNMMKLIDIPVSVVGEATGTVYRATGNKQEGLGRIILNIFDKNEKMVGRILSEPDGFYSFLGLRPGDYVVMVDTLQTKKLNLLCSPAKHPFTVRENREGDVIEGLDFVLTSKEPEKTVPQPQPASSLLEPAPAPDTIGIKKSEFKKVTPTTLQVATTSPIPTTRTAQKAPDKISQKASSSEMAGKHYFIQVGAFSNKENASRLAETVKGLIPFPVVISYSGGLYLVRFGPFPSVQESKKYHSILKNDGFENFAEKT